jgi:hypothetical protein
MSSESALRAFSLESPAAESHLTAPVRFTVPILDNDEFASLKAKRRSEVNLTLRVLERIHALRGERTFVAAVGTMAIGYRHMRGFSAASLLRNYYVFIRSGCDWRSLVKGYKAPSQQPKEFQDFVKGLIEQNPRSIAQALSVLRDELWPAGVSIPGYGTWQEWYARTFPAQEVPKAFPRVWPVGWNVGNLRRYGPSRAQRALWQRGIAAAHGLLPTIVRDTSRLRPMEMIVIDDFQLDTMCCFRGDPERGIKPQIAYVAGLMSMCVGTRKPLSWLLGPLVERQVKQADGTMKAVVCNIRAVDVQMLLYKIFQEHGLPPYPITILCENATAAISPALELMLSTIYEGRIRVHRTSLIEHKTLTNGFVERGGTPWEKGWIESYFNKLWNMLAQSQRGYKGSNERLNAPGDLSDKLRICARLLGQGAGKLNLPPEVIDLLKTPFPSLEELEQAFANVVSMSERRTKHKCLGFGTVTEFRWSQPELPAPAGIDPTGPNTFRSLACIAPEQQKLMLPEERKESPLERWERLSADNPRVALRAQTLALFLLSPNKATWRKHAVTFVREGTGYSYVDDENKLAEVPEGTDLLAYVDTARPSVALVTKVDGSSLGVLRMLGNSPRGVDITDTAAMDDARARRAAIVNRLLATVRARPLHEAANQQLAANQAHNDAIVDTWKRSMTPAAIVPGAPRPEAAIATADMVAAGIGVAASRQAEASAQARALRRCSNEAEALLTEAAIPAAPASQSAEFRPEDLL